MRFLFYLEREFHLDLLKNLIIYIFNHKLGEIALWSPTYRESSFLHPNLGCQKDLATKNLINIDFLWFDKKPFDFHPDLCFMADSSYEAVEGLGFIVNIGHGTICKGSFYSDTDLSKRENCADLLCVPSNLHYQLMKRHLWTNMIVSGMPKFDSLKNYPLNREEILKKYHLNTKNKTLLFAPTFNPEFSIVPYIQDNLRQYIDENYNIIIKLHGVSPKEWTLNYKNLAINSKNIALIEDFAITESLIASDIIVSDVSSIAYELSAFGKAVLVFDSPNMKNHPKYNPDDLEYKYRHQLIRFNELKQLPELLSLTQYFKPQLTNQPFLNTEINSSETIIQKAISLFHSKKELYHTYYTDSNESFKRNVLISMRLDTPLLVINPKIKKSPFVEKFLLNQLFLNPKADIACPLLYKESPEEQSIFKHFPESINIPAEYIINPLSYRNSFCYKRIYDLSSDCLMIKTDLLRQYLQAGIEDSLSDFINWCLSSDKSVKVCFDALIYY